MATPQSSVAKKGHVRTISTDERRVNFPRRSTKGPLDLGEPPFISGAPPSATPQSSSSSSIATLSVTSPTLPSQRLPTFQTKDLSFLLHPTNFHPLPSSSLLPPFLAAPAAPALATPSELLNTLHFRAAAISAATLLAASPPPDNSTILELWYIHLLSLCLAHSHALAAQEIKVFQDFSSSFYLDAESGRSVLPWELRVLAVSLGSDPRRAVGSYYELATECRAAAVDSTLDRGERLIWKGRLEELGIRVANALVQLGDFSAAGRHLRGLRKRGDMLALLYIRAGMVDEARECVGKDASGVLKGLLLMVDGSWEGAVEVWRGEEGDMAKNNLAVCLLYQGKLLEARKTLESLVEEGVVFPDMIFNLATAYELCGDSSRTLKMQLAEKVAGLGREFTNPSFKM